MTTRRDFLKTIGTLGAAATLPGCGDSGPAEGTRSPTGPGAPGTGSGGSGTPPVPASFDFPTVTPLPFAHGVASGDPLKDRVMIWTRITEVVPSAASIPVGWQVASDPQMTAVLRSGTQTTTADRDWTVKVDVVGLKPATTYYYRFTALGSTSLTGRTRTAPDAKVESIRFAVLSCSSYWSSYWSGLGHIADRNDLDLVVHCGDYIYDFVDQDEGVRARKDLKDTAYVDYRDWLNLTELRRRYALWRSDANNLRAHQQHPWFIVWDNHDLSSSYGNELPSTVTGDGDTTTLDQCCQAFYDWTPSRPVKPDGSGEFVFVDDGSYPVVGSQQFVYRRLPYGPMLDVFGVDTQINLPTYDRPVDSSHLPSGKSLYGRQQYEWFTGGLLASAQAGVQWRFVNNQTWFAPVDTPDLTGTAVLPKVGISRWTDYPEERAAICQYLRGANPAGLRIRNTIVVSGDTHGNLGSDLIDGPALLGTYASGLPVSNTRNGSTADNVLAGYGRATTGNVGALNLRADSVGVEFSPSSMGRGGADELVQNAIKASGQTPATVAGARAIEAALITANKNVQFIEWVDHGYGIVHIATDRAVFEWWWQDKYHPGTPDVLGYQMVTWAQPDATTVPNRFQDQIDSVAAHGLTVTPTVGTRTAAPAPEGVLKPA